MNTETKVTANREYKSTVFSMLFRDKKLLLGLYNALNGSSYTNEEELEMVILENAIYMSMKNDLAFILDNRLTLYEHQSTPNPNMPLRDLFYIAKQYEKLVSSKTLYSTRSVKIPAPHFVVFYNGIEKQPERKILKLSELYQVAEAEPMLELQVTMLNINDGNNEELKESCQVLKEYMHYVNRVRKYIQQNKMKLDDAVEQAVTECIREGILEDFLRKNRAEVTAMSIFEFDEEKEWKLIRETEYQYGVEDGREEGRCAGMREGRRLYLIENICKKLKKGKNYITIAEELEEEVANIKNICEAVKPFAPEYDMEKILQAEQEGKLTLGSEELQTF